MKNEILNKSLLELGEWTWLWQPSDDNLQSDRITMELDCLSKKKLCDYSNSDIYLAVSQEKGLRFTLPLAIRLIEDDILIECEFYSGDLLKAVLQIPTTYYQLNVDDFIKVASLISLKDNKRIMFDYHDNRELCRLYDLWGDYRKSYWVRIITNNYRLPIDDVKDFIYQTVGDDSSSEVDFSDYTRYWKSDNQGELTAMISTVIPFGVLRKRIAEQWTPADRIGNSFVANSRTMEINYKQISWISIGLED